MIIETYFTVNLPGEWNLVTASASHHEGHYSQNGSALYFTVAKLARLLTLEEKNEKLRTFFNGWFTVSKSNIPRDAFAMTTIKQSVPDGMVVGTCPFDQGNTCSIAIGAISEKTILLGRICASSDGVCVSLADAFCDTIQFIE